jgi:3-hydroxyacyl-CoA dehydrogenase
MTSIKVVDFSEAGSNPLNPLGLELRRLIWKSLDEAAKDPSIKSVVLTGGIGRSFSAGADLTEFGKLQSASSVSSEESYPLPELVNKIEKFTKPVVAAIGGSALGGGLEVALSCHYRITDRSGKFALPEVHVGVIPGAHGTQRLPRLVGVQKALDLILTGRTIKAPQAKKIGLVDHISEDLPLLESAKKWAMWAELMPLEDRRVGLMKIKENPKDLGPIFAFAYYQLPAPEAGGEGVHAALRAIRACVLPIEEGSQVELENFFQTLTGLQGRARRHAFFAARKAQKPLGVAPKDHPLLAKSVQGVEVGVVGAGLMGAGISFVLLNAGFTLNLVDISKPSLDKGVAFLQGTIKSYVKKGKLSSQKAKQMLASIKPTQKMEDLSSCKLVVEAVIEVLSIKQKIFSALDRITPPNTILLSNTSTLDIDAMASALSPARQALFAGWHFFSPAHIMKLVEIIKGKATSHATVCVLQELTKRIKKTGVVAGNCDGFIGNRLLISYSAETVFLLEEGVATVESVDKAFLKFGIALGPLQMGDLAGLDVGYNIRKQRGWVNENGKPGKNRPNRYTDLGDDLVTELKRLGQKSGKGWYDYKPNIGKGRRPLPSKEVNEFVKKYVKEQRPAFSDEEIIERVLYPLVNEGFKCLEEGIAQQPSDIDVVYLYGYGWPVYRGGPMFWADHEVGLSKLLEGLRHFSRQFPTTNYYTPSKLLETCVAMNLTVEEYYAKGLHKDNKLVSKL